MIKYRFLKFFKVIIVLFSSIAIYCKKNIEIGPVFAILAVTDAAANANANANGDDYDQKVILS